MKSILLASSMALLLGSSFLTSCKDDDNNNNTTAGKATVSMHLTDGPADYDAIYLDIESVEVTMAGGSPIVLTPIRPGLYDILRFRNGMDTLLVRADLPVGTINQIRLILGPNNSIVVNYARAQYAFRTGERPEAQSQPDFRSQWRLRHLDRLRRRQVYPPDWQWSVQA